MKLLTIMLVTAAGATLLVSNSLQFGPRALSLSTLKDGSIAAYCADAIPGILQAHDEKRSSEETFIENAAGSAVFKRVGMSFCLCADETYVSSGAAKENEIFGQMAGLYLKLRFSNQLSREYRDTLKAEGVNLYQSNRSILERNPAILNSTAKIFRKCERAQRLFDQS